MDGQLIGPSDRRMGMASGPFQMAPNDTQEVVVAEIVAGAIPGVDRISAIGLLKYYDQQAQLAYDNFFNLPVAPAAPEVNVVESDKQIILDWGENPSKVTETESQDSKGYKFQGYNVYQLPSASAGITEGKLIATYDLADGIGKIFDDVFDVNTGSVVNLPVKFGNDTGIKRFISITSDELKGGVPLINGIKYYYAVTAYNYNPDVTVSTSLENPLKIITVVPHTTDPGVGYEFAYSDTISGVQHSAGASDGNVFPVVVDPSKLTGLTYKISFGKMTVTTVNDTGGVESSEVDIWNVDRSDGVRVLSNQTNQNADDQSPIVDGIQFKVIGAPLDFKKFSVVANGNGAIDPAEGGAFDFGNFPSDRPTEAQQVGDGLWGIHTADNGGTNDGGTRALYDAFISRATRDGGNWPEIIPYDFEMRFTGSNANPGVGGSQAYEYFNDGNVFWVPFELWNIGIGTPNDPSDDYRMVPYIIDDAGAYPDHSGEGDNIFDLESWGDATNGGGDLEHSVSGGNNDPFTDWVYWYRPEDTSPGEAGYKAAES